MKRDVVPKPPRFLLARVGDKASERVIKEYQGLPDGMGEKRTRFKTMKTLLVHQDALERRCLSSVFDFQVSMDDIVLLYDVPFMEEPSWAQLSGLHRLPRDIVIRPRWAIGVAQRIARPDPVVDRAERTAAKAVHIAELIRAYFGTDHMKCAFDKKQLPWGPFPKKVSMKFDEDREALPSAFRTRYAVA